jgi:hypothetical protein
MERPACPPCTNAPVSKRTTNELTNWGDRALSANVIAQILGCGVGWGVAGVWRVGRLEVEGVAGDAALVSQEPVLGVDASGEPGE